MHSCSPRTFRGIEGGCAFCEGRADKKGETEVQDFLNSLCVAGRSALSESAITHHRQAGVRPTAT